MDNVIEIISKLDKLATLKGADNASIKEAQDKLGLIFAQDYSKYLENYGAISARSVELTGITESPRLNVVAVTFAERSRNQIPDDMYVIEDIHIEGIIILQNGKSEIFELRDSNHIIKIFDSLADYLGSKL